MALQAILRGSIRHLAWPLVVVGALNLESWASKLGYDHLLGDALSGAGPMMQGLYQVLTSDAANHVWLFLAGGCLFAWLNHWFGKLDERSGRPTPYWLGMQCDAVADVLEKPCIMRWLTDVRKEVAKLNAMLRAVDLEEIPEFDRNNDALNRRSERYLRAMYPFLKAGDFTTAKEVGSTILSLEKAKAVKRRSPLDIG